MGFTRVTKKEEADDEQPLRLRPVDGDPATLKSAVVEGMTSAVLDAKHIYFTLKWKESRTFRACHTALQDTIMVQQNPKVTQCMCLGLGTFTGDDRERDNDDGDRDDSLMQLVAFECMIEQLSKDSHITQMEIKKLTKTQGRSSQSDMYIFKTQPSALLTSSCSKARATRSFTPRNLMTT